MIDANLWGYAGLSFHIWCTLAIIALAIILFAKETFTIEFSSVFIIALLLIFFYAFPLMGTNGKPLLSTRELLQGFAEPVLFSIMGLLIVGHGLFHTGALEAPAKLLTKIARKSPSLAIALALFSIGVMSAFMNNTPIVVLSIPILTALAININMPSSKLLMPLSYISILGGMVTIIGSSANLLVKSLAEERGVATIGFFDQAHLGLILALIGALYVIFILPNILGRKDETPSQALTSNEGAQFISELTITDDHPWEGLTSKAGLFPDLRGISIRMIHRDGKRLLPPFDLTLAVGDTVMFSSTRRTLTSAHIKNEQASEKIASNLEKDLLVDEQQRTNQQQLSIVEAVVAPASRLLGRTVDGEMIHAESGCIFVGLQRQSRMARQPLSNISLASGDVMLLLGTAKEIDSLANNRNLLLVDATKEDLKQTQHAKTAIIIFTLTIFSVALGLLPIEIAAFLGATAIVLFGCLNIRQALRAVDRQVYFLIGCAFAMAQALDKTGGALLFATSIADWFSNSSLALLASVLFIFTAILTNCLSNSATAALMTPIIVHIAHAAGTPPEFFLYGLIFALNCSFLSPIGYQTNLIVMAPGNYSFKDFLVGGLPLLLIIWLSYTILAYIHFGTA